MIRRALPPTTPFRQLVLGAALCTAIGPVFAEDQAFLVSGAGQGALIEAIEAAGGEVTHHLPIIQAVGARLPASAESTLEGQDGLHLHRDASLAVASHGDAPRFRVDKKKLYWELENPSDAVRVLDRLELSWPASNGKLKKVKLDGEEVYGSVTGTSAKLTSGDWKKDAAKRALSGASSLELKLEFEHDAEADPFAYHLEAALDDSSTLRFQPPSCVVTDTGSVKIDKNKLEWEVENLGYGPATIASVALSWPRESGSLKKLRFDGDEIFKAYREAPGTMVVGDWHEDVGRRVIDAGDHAKLKAEFEEDIDASIDAFRVEISFEQECTVVLDQASEADDDDRGFARAFKADKKARDTFFPAQIGADKLHEAGVTGAGIGIALLDTGVWTGGKGKDFLLKDTSGAERIIAYNAIDDRAGDIKKINDKHGHGSHLSSLMVSSRAAEQEDGRVRANSVAPDATLVAIKAFDDDGVGTYADVIRGIQWVLDNQRSTTFAS